MSTTPEELAQRRLVARTRKLDIAQTWDQTLQTLGSDGYAWIQDGVGFVTSGVIARVAVNDAAAALATIVVENDLELPATGAIAVGALPFDVTDRSELVIPARVTGHSANGVQWTTEITGDAHPEQADPGAASTPSDVVTWTKTDDDATREAYEANVRAAVERILRGELHKLVLAREVTFERESPFELRDVLARLLINQPGCIVFAAPGFVGASPELLVRRSGTVVESRPMAGTVSRGQDRPSDLQATHLLTHSIKDAIEHRFVVDDVVATLRRTCDDVRASDVPDVVSLQTVSHLTTTITARLRATEDDEPIATALDLARALHPTPAVCGTPTDVAREALRTMETFDRGRYAGPIGWVDAHGDGAWALALRGAEISGRQARVIVGAGIVAESDPAAEWFETEAKLAGTRSALLTEGSTRT